MAVVFAGIVTIILKKGLFGVRVAMQWYDIPLETEKIRCCRGYENKCFDDYFDSNFTHMHFCIWSCYANDDTGSSG